jgi:hypothetical protein
MDNVYLRDEHTTIINAIYRSSFISNLQLDAPGFKVSDAVAGEQLIPGLDLGSSNVHLRLARKYHPPSVLMSNLQSNSVQQVVMVIYKP